MTGVYKKYDYESPICAKCGIRKRQFNGFKKDGSYKFKKLCYTCSGQYQKRKDNPKYVPHRQKPYKEAILRKRETMTCEICGFKAEHACQLDIDHIDGNHDNNDSSNHQIICANCHRLKSKRNNDYKN